MATLPHVPGLSGAGGAQALLDPARLSRLRSSLPPSLLPTLDRAKLAEDSGIDDDSGGWGGVTLAHNVRSREEVDAVIDQARAAGARIARPGATTFWGGYSGVFVDPDGHPWEVAHNPDWRLLADGSVSLE